MQEDTEGERGQGGIWGERTALSETFASIGKEAQRGRMRTRGKREYH